MSWYKVSREETEHLKENVGCASPRFGLFKGVKNEEKTCWLYRKIGTKLSLREQRSGNNWAFHPRERTFFFLMRNSEIKWYTITLKADLTCLDEEALEGGPARVSPRSPHNHTPPFPAESVQPFRVWPQRVEFNDLGTNFLLVLVN